MFSLLRVMEQTGMKTQEVLIDKSKMVDSTGRPLTQGLFLEIGYGPFAVYTLKEYDHTWEGRLYPSLKKRYLEMADVTEYDFATTYLLNWKQWQRLCENKAVSVHINEWREELEYKIRSKAAKKMIEQADGGNYQAAKWLLDKGWINRGAGRPTKEEKAHHLATEERIRSEYDDDIQRLRIVK